MEKANREEQEWTIEEKFNKKIKLDREKVKEIVPQKFHKWLKVFEKAELERQLRKEYIRPSKSPQTSPVFFVGKKDRKK